MTSPDPVHRVHAELLHPQLTEQGYRWQPETSAPSARCINTDTIICQHAQTNNVTSTQSHSVYILPKYGLLIVYLCISNKNVQYLKSHQLTELRPKISESSEKLVRKRVSGVSRGSRSITQESESTSLMSFLLGSRHKNTNYNRTLASKCKNVL